ncbi:hypothetical protein ACFLZV_05215, partial [Candidatus Margulisiibacteriota bacterium]
MGIDSINVGKSRSLPDRGTKKVGNGVKKQTSYLKGHGFLGLGGYLKKTTAFIKSRVINVLSFVSGKKGSPDKTGKPQDPDKISLYKSPQQQLEEKLDFHLEQMDKRLDLYEGHQKKVESMKARSQTLEKVGGSLTKKALEGRKRLTRRKFLRSQVKFFVKFRLSSKANDPFKEKISGKRFNGLVGDLFKHDLGKSSRPSDNLLILRTVEEADVPGLDIKSTLGKKLKKAIGLSPKEELTKERTREEIDKAFNKIKEDLTKYVSENKTDKQAKQALAKLKRHNVGKWLGSLRNQKLLDRLPKKSRKSIFICMMALKQTGKIEKPVAKKSRQKTALYLPQILSH